MAGPTTCNWVSRLTTRRCLPILKAAAKHEEIAAIHVASLEDRICVFEGRPQRYGRSFDWDEIGMLSPDPLQDPERVDHYRKSVGPGTLSKKLRKYDCTLQLKFMNNCTTFANI